MSVFEVQNDERRALGVASSTFDPMQWQLSGTVIGYGTGYPKDDAPPNTSAPPNTTKLSFLRVRGDDRTWTLIVSDIPSFGVRPGAMVSVSFSHVGGGFAPSKDWLTLSVGDTIALHYSAFGRVSDLVVPSGWQVEQKTSRLCEAHETCGSWASYELSVTDPSGERAVLRAGEPHTLGDYTAFGGSSQQLPQSGGQCPDWFVSASELVLIRQPALEPAAFSCKPTRQSTLPGVEIQFDDQQVCKFAAGGTAIRIPYRVVVAQDVPGVSSSAQDIGGCMVGKAGELSLFEQVSGNGQYYGLRDIGGCGGSRSGPAGTLPRGTTEHEFVWDGSNWSGPSDTFQPKGGPFPPGIYTFTVKARGAYGLDADDAGAATPFEVSASFELLIDAR